MFDVLCMKKRYIPDTFRDQNNIKYDFSFDLSSSTYHNNTEGNLQLTLTCQEDWNVCIIPRTVRVAQMEKKII